MIAGGNCGPGGKQWYPTAGFMTHVTCRLTAKNRDQLRNHTVGNRVWATITFLNRPKQRFRYNNTEVNYNEYFTAT